jgi:HSP20 family protein
MGMIDPSVESLGRRSKNQMESRSERDIGELRERLLEAMAPLRELKTNMNSLFGEFYPGDWEAVVNEIGSPMLVNFYRSGDRAVIECTVPGARKQDIEITMAGNVLTISAEFRRSGDQAADRYLKREIPSGRQQRAIQIPFRVQPEQMKARYENGILRIVINAVGENESRQSRLSIE